MRFLRPYTTTHLPGGFIADAALRSASFAEIGIFDAGRSRNPVHIHAARFKTNPSPGPPPSQRPFLARLWPPEWLNPDAAWVDLRQEDPARSGSEVLKRPIYIFTECEDLV